MNGKDGYNSVIYDLDGTLVKLNVDWVEVRDAVAETLLEKGVDSKDASLWDMLEIGEKRGLENEVERVISEYECEGARNSESLRTADILASQNRGNRAVTGVCSLNSEESCRVALETHGIEDCVDVVVGRDTVDERKPDPEPLLKTAGMMDVDVDETVFVGDSERDEVAAQRAGMDFFYVEEWLG